MKIITWCNNPKYKQRNICLYRHSCLKDKWIECKYLVERAENPGHKTAKETIASLPVIDDPVISDALREVGL